MTAYSCTDPDHVLVAIGIFLESGWHRLAAAVQLGHTAARFRVDGTFSDAYQGAFASASIAALARSKASASLLLSTTINRFSRFRPRSASTSTPSG